MKIAKFLLGIVFCNLYRLLRSIPNNDPIMGLMLPYARQEKWWTAALFAFITMISFDMLTGMIGVWTIVTAVTYAGLGIAFNRFYRGRTITMKTYLLSGVAGVLIFDFITGPIASSFMFNMPFWVAFAGQIPFTALHLGSVSFFVFFLVPLLDKQLVNNSQLEDAPLMRKLVALVG